MLTAVTVHHDQYPSTSKGGGGKTTIADLLKKRKKISSDSSSNGDEENEHLDLNFFYDSDDLNLSIDMDILSDSDEALRSDEESEPEQESEPEEESGKEKMLQSTWELVKQFKNKSEFTAFLKSEGCWSFRSSQKLASGIKTY